ncbi:MAG: hypothetical protein AMXMBFR4_13060 [Candidatus Hydrogenedentota bacterium]
MYGLVADAGTIQFLDERRQQPIDTGMPVRIRANHRDTTARFNSVKKTIRHSDGGFQRTTKCRRNISKSGDVRDFENRESSAPVHRAFQRAGAIWKPNRHCMRMNRRTIVAFLLP